MKINVRFAMFMTVASFVLMTSTAQAQYTWTSLSPAPGPGGGATGTRNSQSVSATLNWGPNDPQPTNLWFTPYPTNPGSFPPNTTVSTSPVFTFINPNGGGSMTVTGTINFGTPGMGVGSFYVIQWSYMLPGQGMPIVMGYQITVK